jgi:hypothetical protein
MAQTSQLLDLVARSLGGDTRRRLGSLIGADEDRTATALSTALPLLISALARNTESPAGASSLLGALTRDHDGSVLEDPAGFLTRPGGGPAAGAGILEHVFGSRQPQAQQAIGKASGLDGRQVATLLAAAAPLVLAAIGRMQRERGLDANALSTYLGSERQRMAGSTPGVAGLASRVLDTDGDGDVDLTDLAGVTGSLGKLLRGR